MTGSQTVPGAAAHVPLFPARDAPSTPAANNLKKREDKKHLVKAVLEELKSMEKDIHPSWYEYGKVLRLFNVTDKPIYQFTLDYRAGLTEHFDEHDCHKYWRKHRITQPEKLPAHINPFPGTFSSHPENLDTMWVRPKDEKGNPIKNPLVYHLDLKRQIQEMYPRCRELSQIAKQNAETMKKLTKRFKDIDKSDPLAASQIYGLGAIIRAAKSSAEALTGRKVVYDALARLGMTQYFNNLVELAGSGMHGSTDFVTWFKNLKGVKGENNKTIPKANLVDEVKKLI